MTTVSANNLHLLSFYHTQNAIDVRVRITIMASVMRDSRVIACTRNHTRDDFPNFR